MPEPLSSVSVRKLLRRVSRNIEREESWRARPYYDTKDLATIGYGFLVDPRRPGRPMPREVGDLWLAFILADIVHELDAAIPWWKGLSEPRQSVLVEMAYQLGVPGLLGFRRALAAMQVGAWAVAAREMLDSKWAREDSPARAQRAAQVMENGE